MGRNAWLGDDDDGGHNSTTTCRDEWDGWMEDVGWVERGVVFDDLLGGLFCFLLHWDSGFLLTD